MFKGDTNLGLDVPVPESAIIGKLLSQEKVVHAKRRTFYSCGMVSADFVFSISFRHSASLFKQKEYVNSLAFWSEEDEDEDFLFNESRTPT